MSVSIIFLQADEALVMDCAVLMQMRDYQQLLKEIMTRGQQIATLDREAWDILTDWAISEMRLTIPWHRRLPSAGGRDCPLVFAVSANQVASMRRGWETIRWERDTAKRICECYSRDPDQLAQKIEEVHSLVRMVSNADDPMASVMGCMVKDGSPAGLAEGVPQPTA